MPRAVGVRGGRQDVVEIQIWDLTKTKTIIKTHFIFIHFSFYINVLIIETLKFAKSVVCFYFPFYANFDGTRFTEGHLKAARH